MTDTELPWATYNRGNPITRRQLARLLAPYGIKPKTVRFKSQTPRGYELAQFADAFAPYVAPTGALPQRGNEPAVPSGGKTGNVADDGAVAATEYPDETFILLQPLQRGGVADRTDSPGVPPADGDTSSY